MARNPYRRYEVTEYQKEALKFLQPPKDITVSEWADKYRVLDAKTSAMPGPWRTEHTPYLKGIMDEFNNYETEEIVYVKPTQVGGTECLQNMVGYIVQQDPAPTMIVYPTDTLAKSISENRLQPMFKAAPELRKRFDENSQLQELQFDGMYLTLAGSNSPSSLASKAIRFLFLDEVDKYPGASKKEADPVSLARERTKTFHNRKIFITSTPTLKTGHIWKAKEDADIEKHYFVPWDNKDKYFEHAWITAPKKWIDPQKEANANKIALNTGQKTFKQIAAEQGRDWKEQIDEMAEVLEYAKDKGIDLGGVIFDQTAAELYEDEETPADNPQQTDGNQTGEETGQESEEGDGAEEEGETDNQGTDS